MVLEFDKNRLSYAQKKKIKSEELKAKEVKQAHIPLVESWIVKLYGQNIAKLKSLEKICQLVYILIVSYRFCINFNMYIFCIKLCIKQKEKGFKDTIFYIL